MLCIMRRMMPGDDGFGPGARWRTFARYSGVLWARNSIAHWGN
jgi:hypothetical protein